jgi:hypothetical protein
MSSTILDDKYTQIKNVLSKEYKELKDKYDDLVVRHTENMAKHVKLLEYTRKVELERDELKQRFELSQFITNDLKQHNKEIDDIIREKKKRLNVDGEDLELQECIATKKRKFEQMFIDKFLYKKIN